MNQLSLEVVIDNPDLINVSVNGITLNIESADEDSFGSAQLTLTVLDTDSKTSSTVLTVQVANVNDAPTLDLSDMSDIRLKKGEELLVALAPLLNDVDDPNNEIFVVTTSTPINAARFNMLDNSLILKWETTGVKQVLFTVSDRHDDKNMYTLQVEVYDSLPLYVSTTDESADIVISMENAYIGEHPTVTMLITNSEMGLNQVNTDWQICSITEGICYEFMILEHTRGSSQWVYNLLGGDDGFTRSDSNGGLLPFDQLKLVSVIAVDKDGEDRKYHGTLYWNITEGAPEIVEPTQEELQAQVDAAKATIASLEAELAQLREDGTEEDIAAKEVELDAAEEAYSEACENTKVTCASDETKGQNAGSSVDSNMTIIIAGIVGLILAFTLGMLLVGKKGSRSDIGVVDYSHSLPADDQIANSMFGGAQDIFQQPVQSAPATMAQQQPTIQQQPMMATSQVPGTMPQLPPGGLPPGWTMEQWQHYGNQYLQENGYL